MVFSGSKRDNSLLVSELRDYVGKRISDFDDDYLEQVIILVKERADFVSNIWDQSIFFFVAPQDYEEKAVKKHWKEDTPELMANILNIISSQTEFTSAALEQAVKDWIGTENIGFGKVMAPLRLILVGALQGPHLFDIMALIGKEECINRIKQAIDRLKPM